MSEKRKHAEAFLGKGIDLLFPLFFFVLLLANLCVYISIHVHNVFERVGALGGRKRVDGYELRAFRVPLLIPISTCGERRLAFAHCSTLLLEVMKRPFEFLSENHPSVFI